MLKVFQINKIFSVAFPKFYWLVLRSRHFLAIEPEPTQEFWRCAPVPAFSVFYIWFLYRYHKIYFLNLVQHFKMFERDNGTRLFTANICMLKHFRIRLWFAKMRKFWLCWAKTTYLKLIIEDPEYCINVNPLILILCLSL